MQIFSSRSSLIVLGFSLRRYFALRGWIPAAVKKAGDEPISFALSTNDTDLEGTPITVASGDENQRSTPNLNGDTYADHLLLQNNDGVSVDYKIWIVE